jgi:hypothetical protein
MEIEGKKRGNEEKKRKSRSRKRGKKRDGI